MKVTRRLRLSPRCQWKLLAGLFHWPVKNDGAYKPWRYQVDRKIITNSPLYATDRDKIEYALSQMIEPIFSDIQGWAANPEPPDSSGVMVSFTPFSVRDRLDAIQKGQTPRFSYKIAEDRPTDSEGGEVIPWSRESSDFILRQVARDARWHAFLFHGSYYWTENLSQYFLPPGQPQDNFPADDGEVLRARSKLVDIVRT
jgi:hypothetical protein